MRAGEARSQRVLAQPAQRGFTYVFMLTALTLFSIGLAAIGPAWADRVRREREQELIRLGSLYAAAIASYYAAAPGSLRQYPPELKDLLEDTRRVGTLRHIRKLYKEPLDSSRQWGIVRAADGGVMGVFSKSDEAPFHTAALDIGSAVLAPAERYSAWKFIPRVAER